MIALDWLYYPHVFDLVYGYLDAEGLETVGLTCSALRARVETDLWLRVTLGHKTTMSTEQGVATPQAVLYGQTQLFSTRYGTRMPAAFTNGHPRLTKVVDVHHRPLAETLLESWACDPSQCGLCPTPGHLTEILRKCAMAVVHFPRAEQAGCRGVHEACRDGGTAVCISSFRADLDYANVFAFAPRQVFSLTYPPGGHPPLDLDVDGWDGLDCDELFVLCKPEQTQNLQDRTPAKFSPRGVEYIVKTIADHTACKAPPRLTFVAIDAWPPDAAEGLRRPTPDTSRQAYEEAIEAFRVHWAGVADADKNNIAPADLEIIDWDQLRDRIGNTACNVLTFE